MSQMNPQEAIKTFLSPAVAAGCLTQQAFERAVAAAAPAADQTLIPRLLTVSQAAERLSCCSKTVLRLAAAGRLRKVYLTPGAPKSMRLRETDVMAFIEDTTREAGSSPNAGI